MIISSRCVNSHNRSYDNIDIISVNQAMNIIVIKTLPGMANAAASALDSMHLEECVGTIAGDDTIFAACNGIDEAKALAITISDMMEKG